MEGVSFSRILRHSPGVLPDSSSSASSSSSNEGRTDVDTLAASSTTGSSYTACSRGSIPAHVHHSDRGEHNVLTTNNRADGGGDEVAVGVLEDAPHDRSGHSMSKERPSEEKGGVDISTSSSSGAAAGKTVTPNANTMLVTDDSAGSGPTMGGLPVLMKRVDLKPHVDLDDDSTSLRAYWDALFYPEVYMKLFYALRITLLVALPLVILARHPKVRGIFPAHVVLPLWGIVDCKYTVGEQLAQSIVSIQCAIWMMAWGAANNSWNLVNHYDAWWFAAIFGAFCVSLLGDVRAKRLLILQTVMILQMENLPGGEQLIYPVKVGRDMILSTAFAIFQVWIPPRFIATDCDELIASGWKDVGRLLRTAVTAVWTDDPIQSVIALGKLSTDPLQHIFEQAPPMLFAIMYEPFESTLRLELRKERLEIMKLCTPRIHCVTGTAWTLVMKRVFNINNDAHKKDEAAVQEKADRETRKHTHHHHPHIHVHHHHRKTGEELDAAQQQPQQLQQQQKEDGTPWRAGRGGVPHSPLSEGSREPFHEDAEDGNELPKKSGSSETESNPPEYFTTVRRSFSKLFGLRGSQKSAGQPRASTTGDYHKGKDIYVEPLTASDAESDSEDDDAEAEASPYTRAGGRERRVRDKEMEKLKQSRLKVQYQMEQRLRSFGKVIIKEPLDRFLDKLDDVLDGLGKHLNPSETVANVPFAELQDASADLEAALNKVHFEMLIKSNDPVDPFIYSNTIFFHLSMIVLAERLVAYGQLMKNFDRKRYKSQWARAWEFFFYDWWKGFWAAIPKRLTLATPRDRRILKDGIKMTLAYGVGIMFTEYSDPENVYYFGMAILMGVGWPTAGDTMVASVYRVTGMVCACSIAYAAVWHTGNLAQEIAIALAGTFIALIFRDVPPYSHTAQYCSMLICTALNNASTKYVLLSRIVSNSFTVMSYYAICIFVFPINVLKVTQATETRAIMAITDRFSALTDIMTNPLYPDDPDHANVIDHALSRIHTQRAQMWGLVRAFGQWLPKAFNEPSTHGQPYPLAQQTAVHQSLRRLAAVTDIVCAALQHLHRSGAAERDRCNVQAMLHAVVPVMVHIDRRARVVMQDFIDAAARPYEWSPERATRHLTDFLFLSNDLHRAFYVAHRRTTRALRQHFSDGVMHRTFAAAARANLIEPSAAAAASAALSGGNRRQCRGRGEGGAGGGPSGGGATSPGAIRRSLPSPQVPQDAAAVHYAPGTDPTLLTSRVSSSIYMSGAASNGGDSSGNGPSRFHAGVSDEDGDEFEHDDPPLPPPVTNESVTASILGHLKRIEGTSRTLSPRAPSEADPNMSRGTGGGSDGGGDPQTHSPSPPRQPASPPAPRVKAAAADDGHGNPLQAEGGTASGDVRRARPTREEVSSNTSFTRVLNNRSMTAKDLEHALRPMERQAEDDEYHAFIAKRTNPHFMLDESDFTLNHDLNAVISLLVAADIFFAEAEKLVKNMYCINSYAKSHQPVPGSSLWDVDLGKKAKRE